MNLNDSIQLALKKFFRNKFSILSFFLIAVAFLIINLTYTCTNSINIYANKSADNNLNFRTLFVYDDSSRDINENIEYLSSLEHVINVVQEKAFLIPAEITNDITKNLDANILIYGLDNNLMKSLSGKTNNFSKDSSKREIICPKIFYPNSNVEYFKDESENIIDGSSLINKKLVLYFNNIKLEEEYEVIGTYDSIYSSENICYISFDNVLRLNNLDNHYLDNQQYMLFIDNAQNIDALQKLLLSNNYYSSVAGHKNPNLINQVNNYGYTLSFLTLIVALLCIIFSNVKLLNEQKSFYASLKVIGYNNNDILKLFVLDNGIIFMFGYILSLLLYYLMLIFLKVYSNKILFLQKTPFIVNYQFLALLFICSLFLCIFLSLFLGFKIKNIKIIEDIKE